jgi:hypothetical protein
MEFGKKEKTAKVGKGRLKTKLVKYCTGCLLCPDCRFVRNIHDARLGRFIE